MRISELKKILDDLPGDEEIIVAWWRREESFPYLDQESWGELCSEIDNDLTWPDGAHEAIQDVALSLSRRKANASDLETVDHETQTFSTDKDKYD